MKNTSEFQIELNRNDVSDVNPFSVPLKQKCSCQQHGWFLMKMKVGAKNRKNTFEFDQVVGVMLEVAAIASTRHWPL